MASNLVLLSYKPGIQRDGTNFQGDMCSNGQWVRFQRGKIKKIGGMQAPALPNYTNNLIASDISLFPYNGNILCYIAGTLNNKPRIYKTVINRDFKSTNNNYNPLNLPNDNTNIKWQSEVVIKNNVREIVFLGTNNANDINDISASILYHLALIPNNFNTNLNLIVNATVGIDALINGGMVWSNPYLFLYGSNGLVQYSANNDPLNFVIEANNPASGGRFNISNDKVIWGRPIRGGSNAPAILFWTLSSVVRVINVGDQTVSFKIDVISTSSSIMSTKCVVEYDGLFFWPGTDRFFIYNGVVQEMVNTTNLNYFYDNIDMNFRQKVFGVKNPKYGEIWWFYPEKVRTVGRNQDLSAGTNTRALIYNVRENSWYDTAIYRDCGVFSNDLGILATHGMSLVNPIDNNNWLWRHEYATDEAIENDNNYEITSSFDTPTFGWSSFNPVNSGTGSRAQPIDRWIELRRIEPDFVLDDNDIMNVLVNTQVYAQSPTVRSNPVQFQGNTDKIDMRNQGRQMSLTFSSNKKFEMGNVMMLLGIGDGQ